MKAAIYISLLSLSLTSPAFAEDGSTEIFRYTDWIVFSLALTLTAWLSNQAFNRKIFTIAGEPTYPRYMTRPSQYVLGRLGFVIFSILIYSLIVLYHRDLPIIINTFNKPLAGQIDELIRQKDASYLIITVIASVSFLALLRVEHPLNFYLQFRDMIYSWVAVPTLTRKITTLTKDFLEVPPVAYTSVVEAHPDWGANQADFKINPATIDRAWAELCYLQDWILKQEKSSTGSTFFSEQSFSWAKLSTEFDKLNILVAARRSGIAGAGDQSSAVMDSIADYRRKLARLIACYLVFMNSSRSALVESASQLGINLGEKACENPLRYVGIYLVALFLSVYFGVYFSAVSFDLFHGKGIISSTIDQNTEDVQRWTFLAFGDYGVPIIGILVIRYLAWLKRPVRDYSIIVSYAWILLIAAVLSTFGLAIMAELVGRNAGQWNQFFQVSQNATRWVIGPALICLFITHYLDRQIDPSRPNIERPGQRTLRRIAYIVLFTLLVIAFTLPSMPTIVSHPGEVWELSKLRFVAMGTIVFITLTMTSVAEFALRKPAASQLGTRGNPVLQTSG